MEANMKWIFILLICSGTAAPTVHCLSTTSEQLLDITSGNVSFQHNLHIPASGVYSVSLQHQPRHLPNQVNLNPDSNEDKYEITLSPAVSPVTTCTNQLTDAIGCYSCNRGTGDTAPCYITLDINDVRVADGGIYGGTLSENSGAETETDKLDLIVYVPPRVLPINVNGEDYRSGSSVVVTPGERIVLVMTLEEYYPSLAPSCSINSDHVQTPPGGFTQVVSVEDHNNLTTTVVNKTYIPNDKIEELVNCKFSVDTEETAPFPPIEMYLKAVVPGRETSTVAAGGADRTSVAAGFPRIIMMVLLVVFSSYRSSSAS